MSETRTFAAAIHVRLTPLARGLLLFSPAVLLGNAVGSLMRYPDIGAALFFLPYAVLTTALVLAPRRHWVWYILVGAVAHFITHWPHWTVSWVLLADVANVVRALVAAVLLRRLFDGPPRLDSIRALLVFVVSAVLIAPAAGAAIGAANVMLHGASSTYGAPFRAWFMSNALTGLTVLPAFLHAASDSTRWWRVFREPQRTAEAWLLTVGLVATCAIAFLLPIVGRWHVALPFYAPLPVLIWAALRFGAGGASLALTAVAFAAVWGADRGTGPFLASTPDDNIVALQLFVLLTAIPVLCIAAIGSARRDAVQLYRSLLASVQDRVAILDAGGTVLEANDSWRRFTEGPEPDQFNRVGIGADYLGACRAAAEAGNATAARALPGITGVLNRQARVFEMEYNYEQDGRRQWHAMSVEALERSDGSGGAVVTLRNVTASREAQLEIEEQRRELSHLARVGVLGQLSGALAHELNQPLAAISNNVQAAARLLNREPTDVAEVNAILQDILSDDLRAAQVIHRLSALLRRGETHLQPMNASDLLKEVLEIAHAELITRRVTVQTSIAPELPLILGDRVQLQQVLLNLILNACEAMSATPLPDRCLVLTATTSASRFVDVSVRDHGTGIPPALIDRLFEPFVTTKAEGLGLGLSISRTIVAAHGGRLWAENNPDGGATLHCVLAPAP